LANPSYATEFRAVEGRIFVIPSFSGSQSLEASSGDFASAQGRPIDYSNLSPVIVFHSFTRRQNCHGRERGGFAQWNTVAYFATTIPDRAIWPYVRQWHVDVQRSLPANTVATLSYVGSKGTHLALQREFNQLHAIPSSQNPFHPVQSITTDICNSQGGTGTSPTFQVNEKGLLGVRGV
jgi:hypothetical protein